MACAISLSFSENFFLDLSVWNLKFLPIFKESDWESENKLCDNQNAVNNNKSLIARSMLVIWLKEGFLSQPTKFGTMSVWLIYNFDGISVFRQHFFAVTDRLSFWSFSSSFQMQKKKCVLFYTNFACSFDQLGIYHILWNKMNVVCVKRL